MREVGTSGRPLPVILEDALRRAGAIVQAHFLAQQEITLKGRGNIVTQVDLLAERAILDLIHEEFPGHAVLSEEAGRIGQEVSDLWVVDPLDGTTNYAQGIGFFCVSMAFARGGQTLVGGIFDPVRDEIFLAERSGGATLNSQAIALADKPALASAIVGFDMGYDEAGRTNALQVVAAARPAVQTFRLLGSAALSLAYVACGRLDLYFHNHLQPWDLAAVLLILEEAGALVTDWQGAPATWQTRAVVAGPAHLQPRFRAIAAEVRSTPAS